MSKVEEHKVVAEYKNDLISQKEDERQRAWDSGNRLDIMISSQLTYISSAVLALIGSMASTTSVSLLPGEMKVILASSFIFIALSLISGLLNIHDKSIFFEKWGNHIHSQIKKIVRENPKTSSKYDELIDDLQDETVEQKTKSSDRFRLLQVVLFLIGLGFSMAYVLANIFK